MLRPVSCGVITVAVFVAASAWGAPPRAADKPPLGASVASPGGEFAPAPAGQPSLPADGYSRRWYGWQTLSADGAAVALFASGFSLGDSRRLSPWTGVGLAGLGTYALSVPILHLAHANPRRALASFGMRVGGPFVLGATGAAVDCLHQIPACKSSLTGGLIGVTVAAVVAMTIDAAVFAYDDPPKSSVPLPRLQVGLGPRGVLAFGTF